MPYASRVTLQEIPSGDAGTRATLRAMRAYAKAGSKSITVREQALECIRPVPGHKNWAGQVHALHAFVQGRIQYVRDIANVETLQTPEMTLNYGQGDCDDQATLLAALLLSVSHPVRFVAIATQPGGPFAHVYCETRIGPKWIPLETTEKWPAGKGPPVFFRRMVMDV